jgi:uncharacterized protein YbjQ (UPF0145 family)
MTTGRARSDVPEGDPPQKPAPPDPRPELLGGQRPEVDAGRILVTAGENFDGYEILAYHGIVWGISVRAKDVGQDFMMGCKNFTGGELDSYADLGDEARQRAMNRMFQSARRQRANAIVNFRFEMAPVGGAGVGAGGVVALGTAVSIKPIPDYIPTGAAGALLRDIADAIKQRP